MTESTQWDEGPGAEDERYRFILEHMGDMITTHRPGDWAYTTISPQTLQISGFTAGEMLGRPAYDFFHPDDAAAMKNKLIPAIYHHGIRTFRYRSLHKSGNYFWVESTHRSIRDADTGELREVIAVTRDISEQVRAEQSTQRLAAVVEASADIILFCDHRTRVTYMNRAAQEGLGLTDDPTSREGAQLELKRLLSTESFQKVKTLAFQVAGTRGNWQGRLRVKSPLAAARYWVLEQVIAQPQLTETDDYFSLIIRDQTEQKRAEREAQDRQAELVHASRLMTLGEMASGLAHEINQPLATTLNYARGSIRQLDRGRQLAPDKLRGVLESITKQAQRAADIVKRLRSMVKRTPYQPVRFMLDDVCAEVLGFLQWEAAGQQVDLHLRRSETPIALVADRIQIEQVLINLVRNAIEAYRGSEAAEKSVQVELQRDALHARIRVTDSAGGVDGNKLEQMFEPYYTSKSAGLGMGLQISRSIVEAHGGQIAARSDGVCRTVLEVVLPL
ncbi:PAS domain S-box protein [Exilibacterium tricleocarpae]|uniref:histidine kinase n=1 Tax=Exilibacterium tricleocarpae TaxID=2591008 RepID=A0A545U9E4_9GAMM|nr:PAS domain S-box protein [Exilibacterium tricleocarpae]TQV86090.1 PAS domain S-box protein [Exilibacterium tricleocarpae]